MTGWVIGFLASGVAMAMPFSLLSDSVDYGEWKGGVRAAGLLTAIGAAFCLKAGSGLGGALPAWILAHFPTCRTWSRRRDSMFGIRVELRLAACDLLCARGAAGVLLLPV